MRGVCAGASCVAATRLRGAVAGGAEPRTAGRAGRQCRSGCSSDRSEEAAGPREQEPVCPQSGQTITASWVTA